MLLLKSAFICSERSVLLSRLTGVMHKALIIAALVSACTMLVILTNRGRLVVTACWCSCPRFHRTDGPNWRASACFDRNERFCCNQANVNNGAYTTNVSYKSWILTLISVFPYLTTATLITIMSYSRFCS